MFARVIAALRCSVFEIYYAKCKYNAKEVILYITCMERLHYYTPYTIVLLNIYVLLAS